MDTSEILQNALIKIDELEQIKENHPINSSMLSDAFPDFPPDMIEKIVEILADEGLIQAHGTWEGHYPRITMTEVGKRKINQHFNG